GTDLAPAKDSLQNEAIPKSAARVFNAQAIRDDFKTKKRKNEDDDGERAGKKQKTDKGKGDKKVSLTIQPGESIQHFNRRVEDDLRPLVKSAAQTSRAFARNVAKAEHEARLEAKKEKQAKSKPQTTEKPQPREDSPPLPSDKFKDRRKEFQVASSSAPKRLSDIAQAPPEFKKLPRGASSLPGIGKRDGVLSMAQKVMMEQEREKAIARYRELKASRRQNGDVGDKLGGDNDE
ncbi:hypothetical protein BJ912DRAFT_853258, partial [Pholiota molesta]